MFLADEITNWQFPTAGNCTSWASRPLPINVKLAEGIGAVNATELTLSAPRVISLPRLGPYSTTVKPQADLRVEEHFCQTPTGGFYDHSGTWKFSLDLPSTFVGWGLPTTFEVGWTIIRDIPLPRSSEIVWEVDVSNVFTKAATTFVHQHVTNNRMLLHVFFRVIGLLKKTELGKIYVKASFQDEYYPNKVDPIHTSHIVAANVSSDRLLLTPVAGSSGVASVSGDQPHPSECDCDECCCSSLELLSADDVKAESNWQLS